jgi:hypothetical protein
VWKTKTEGKLNGLFGGFSGTTREELLSQVLPALGRILL